MSETKWVKTIDDLYEIIKHDKMVELLSDKFGITEQEVLKCHSWDELAFDDLDQVEFIMELEKEYNLAISDEVADGLYRIGFSHFRGMLISKNRMIKLDEIGI